MPPNNFDFNVVKKPNTKTDYNASKLDELLRCADDPLYFMETFMKIQHPLRGALPFHPYPYQRRMIKAMHENRFSIMMTGRQLGKTTVASGYILWRAMFVPDSTILIVANKYLQALEVMQRIHFCYENLPNHIRDAACDYLKGSIGFSNGSRIESRATSADAGRGLAVSLLYADEFAFIPVNKQKEFWTSVQPTLSEGGSCIITSTPKNDEDIFAQLWKGAEDNLDESGNPLPGGVGKNGFFAVKVPWWEHPDRDDTWARPFRESLGEARFLQEMACQFFSDDETLINPMTLSRISTMPPIGYTGTVRWYCDPEPNHAFLVALDPAMGTERNYGAIEVFQMPEMIQVAEWQHNGLAARHQVRVMMEVLYEIDGILRGHPQQVADPEIYWTFENNSLGEGVLTIVEDTGEERFPGSLITERRRKGISMKRVRRGLHTNARNKMSACARLKSLVESDRMTINSNNLLRELKNFVATGNSFAAKSGETDDLVSATLMIVRMLDIALAWGTSAGDLREYISDSEIGDEVEPMPVVI